MTVLFFFSTVYPLIRAVSLFGNNREDYLNTPDTPNDEASPQQEHAEEDDEEEEEDIKAR